MSKNGKLLFRDYDPYITSSFGYRIHPITEVNTLHSGVDYGTNNMKLPTYAIESGKVVKTGYSNTSGNYVYVNYPRLNKNALYQHLDSISVKVGEVVSSETIIGYVGSTGQVTGIHLHFGFFPSVDQNKGWYDKRWEDFEKYEYVKPIITLGEVDDRDLSELQIEVLVDNLRARKDPNGEVLGYIRKGIYTVLDSKVDGDYTWYLVSDNLWIAYDPSWANLYFNSNQEELENEILEELDEDSSLEFETLEESSFFKRIFANIRIFLEKLLNFLK